MDALAASLQVIADWITVHITMWVLIATGPVSYTHLTLPTTPYV